MPTPSLRFERSLMREGPAVVVGMDEVGRGAIAGPVSVGAVAVRLSTPTAPIGLRDSKLLSQAVRERLSPRLSRWAEASAVGHASVSEIDTFGILPALRLAGLRALAQLGTPVDLVLLDGNLDWLGRRHTGDTLFDLRDAPAEPGIPIPPVITRTKADMSCASVAAASVLAKVERDGLMVDLAADQPEYGWQVNKGYATAEHQDALRTHGLSPHHRRSWNLRALARPEEVTA